MLNQTNAMNSIECSDEAFKFFDKTGKGKITPVTTLCVLDKRFQSKGKGKGPACMGKANEMRDKLPKGAKGVGKCCLHPHLSLIHI